MTPLRFTIFPANENRTYADSLAAVVEIDGPYCIVPSGLSSAEVHAHY